MFAAAKPASEVFPDLVAHAEKRRRGPKKKPLKSDAPVENVADHIHTVRGAMVILDRDLGRIFGYTPAKLIEQIKLKVHRFPPDFAFQLTEAEYDALMRRTPAEGEGRRVVRPPPYALTEHGVVMLAGLFQNKRAVQKSIGIVRVFVGLRGIAAD